jgi:hypothetical protein
MLIGHSRVAYVVPLPTCRQPLAPYVDHSFGASASDVVGVGEECGVIGHGGDGESTSAGSHHSLVAAGCATLGWRLGWGGPPVGFLVE